jgi:hypothetical protein
MEAAANLPPSNSSSSPLLRGRVLRKSGQAFLPERRG